MNQNIISIKTEKSNEKITAQSGLLIIGEALIKFKLKEMFEEILPKPASNRGKKASEYLTAMILNFANGGITIEDVIKIFNDKAICKMLNLKEFKSGTINDWLVRKGEEGLSKNIEKIMNKFNQEIIIKTGKKELTLDIDAMSIESNKSTAKMTYKNYKGYMPMLGFIPELFLNIFAEFRTGNTSPRANILEAIQTSIAKLPDGYKFKNYRSDSASFSAEIINFLDENQIRYTITAGLNIAIKKAIEEIEEKDWQTFYDEKGNITNRDYAEIIYAMKDSENAFRIIVQRAKKTIDKKTKQQFLFPEVKYYAIATNDNESSATEIIYWHNKRGNAENCNKEVKYGVNLNYLPSSDFKANEIWFLIGILTFNLFQALKLLTLPKSWANKKIATIRYYLIQIAGKFIYTARQFKLKLCAISQDIFDIFNLCRSNLCVT
ncbi:IS1380 family transposase [Candidatus Woesearchaeota archaeon]|jgi:hypothetical protein|nr:IS1380 family transposase [Candidatus Woesearchaeota archaeon]